MYYVVYVRILLAGNIWYRRASFTTKDEARLWILQQLELGWYRLDKFRIIRE